MFGDNEQDVRRRGNFWQPDDGMRWLLFEMYDTLLPGGSGLAKTLDWNGTEFEVSDRQRTLHDPFECCFAIGSGDMDGGQNGERVKAYYSFDAKRWEVVSEGWMLMRLGVVVGAAACEESVAVTIMPSDFGPGGVSVEARNIVGQLVAGDRVWLNYNGSFGGWYVICRACSSGSGSGSGSSGSSGSLGSFGSSGSGSSGSGSGSSGSGSSGSGSGSGPCFQIPGVDLSQIPVSTSPAYFLGIDAGGCLVKIAVGDCDNGSSGSGGGSGG